MAKNYQNRESRNNTYIRVSNDINITISSSTNSDECASSISDDPSDPDLPDLPRQSNRSMQRGSTMNYNICMSLFYMITAANTLRSFIKMTYRRYTPRRHIHVSCLITPFTDIIFGNNMSEFTHLLGDPYMFHAEAYVIYKTLIQHTDIGRRKADGIMRRAIDKAIRDPYNVSKTKKDLVDNFKFKCISGSDVCVTRINWNYETRYKKSAPCRICMYLMKLFDIKTCYYTSDNIDTLDDIPINNFTIMKPDNITFKDIAEIPCSTGAQCILGR
jgi:hypothetical protein